MHLERRTVKGNNHAAVVRAIVRTFLMQCVRAKTTLDSSGELYLVEVILLSLADVGQLHGNLGGIISPVHLISVSHQCIDTLLRLAIPLIPPTVIPQ